jgi:hypothetical protein
MYYIIIIIIIDIVDDFWTRLYTWIYFYYIIINYNRDGKT